MKKHPRLEAGEVVGEEEHKRIVAELDQARERSVERLRRLEENIK
jgi:hypothetical protein